MIDYLTQLRDNGLGEAPVFLDATHLEQQESSPTEFVLLSNAVPE